MFILSMQIHETFSVFLTFTDFYVIKVIWGSVKLILKNVFNFSLQLNIEKVNYMI